jgi:DNA topoisomerase IB
VRFRFTGKSGKQWSLQVTDRRIAKTIRACHELPGQELLQYIDESGAPRDISSSDVNTYLKEITGRAITAKDFRTWAGTVLAAIALNEMGPSRAQRKRSAICARQSNAARLGNTPTTCRKCYVHPEVLTTYVPRRQADDGDQIRYGRPNRSSQSLSPKRRRYLLCCAAGSRVTCRTPRPRERREKESGRAYALARRVHDLRSTATAGPSTARKAKLTEKGQ